MRIPFAVFLLLSASCAKAKPTGNFQPPRRDLVLTVEAQVTGIPAEAKELVLWIPVPRDESVQVLEQLIPEVPGTSELVVDQELENSALRVVLPRPPASTSARVRFAVSRKEQGPGSGPRPVRQGDPEEDLARWLEDDGLTIVDDRIRAIARRIFDKSMTADEKARAAYDYVLANMVYSKEGEGWGQGSSAWACDAKTGNCTDFHALFMSLVRAGGVPARFRIGFSIPSGPKREAGVEAVSGGGRVQGYHCWAEFHSPARGWVPVDISEAWKKPSRRDYLFGNLDPDRIGVSLGRDIVFEGQAGPAHNYFVLPYAEVDGRPAEIATIVTWAEKR